MTEEKKFDMCEMEEKHEVPLANITDLGIAVSKASMEVFKKPMFIDLNKLVRPGTANTLIYNDIIIIQINPEFANESTEIMKGTFGRIFEDLMSETKKKGE